MAVTPLMAAYIATHLIAVVAGNAVPAAERFVCRRMRLGAVFERANSFAFPTYGLEHHVDSTHIVRTRANHARNLVQGQCEAWCYDSFGGGPDCQDEMYCGGCMECGPTSRALRLSKNAFMRGL